MQFTLPPDFDPCLFPQKSLGCGSAVCRHSSATTGIRGCVYLFLVPQLCWKELAFLSQWMGLAPHLLDPSQPSLENSVRLAVDSFIFHLDWHLVWRSGTLCLCSSRLFLPLLRHAVLLPRNQVKALVGERFATKSSKEGKQFWICCSCCHELTRDVFLLSRQQECLG